VAFANSHLWPASPDCRIWSQGKWCLCLRAISLEYARASASPCRQ